jgi:hypothetical protein
MTADAVASLTPPAVTPVVDYEPPARSGPPAPPRPQPLGGARRGPDRPPPAPRPVDPAAAAFADAALRGVLEVIDRRRPLAQLRPLLAAGLVDSLLAAAERHGDRRMPARLRRVHTQPVGDGTAEVAASYTRGDQVHVIACRIERDGPDGRWQLVALHLG